MGTQDWNRLSKEKHEIAYVRRIAKNLINRIDKNLAADIRVNKYIARRICLAVVKYVTSRHFKRK